MILAERLLIGLGMGAMVVYAATPRAIRLAERLQFYDKPAGYKGHARPTPYLGGAALMAGFVVAILLAASDATEWDRTVPLLGGVLVLWVIGTIDDRRSLSAELRVLVEVGLAVLVWGSGLGWHLHVGWVIDLTLTCLWVVGVVNAFNLFDNMDGAASTMALVVSAGPALIGVVRGDAWLAAGAASLCGACLGFLPRNLSRPAHIFLGDGGSMPIGFAVAIFVMIAAGTSNVAWHSLVVALLLIGMPALDTSLVIVSRRRRGISVLTGGRDHLTHRAHNYLRNARAVALSLGAMQAAISVVAVLASRGEAALLVISASLYLLVSAGVIIWLDTRQIEESAGASREPELPRPMLSKRALASLGVLGLGAGLSPFFFTYYDASVWVPVGLALTLACAIAVVARGAPPSRPAVLALAGLLGLGVFSLCSAAWAESVENAIVGGNRWLAYGSLLLLLLVLVRNQRRAAVLLGAVALGVGAVALSVLARLLGSSPGDLFLGGRLNSPLGYINGEGCLFVMGFWLAMAGAPARRASVAGASAAMATLMACLALLSQSRGTALAMIGSLIAVLALVPDRTRRAYVLLTVAVGVALAAPDLLHIYDHRAAAAIPQAVAHSAGRATLLAAVAVGIVWGLVTAAYDRIPTSEALAARARSAASSLLVVPVMVALVVAAGSAHRIEQGLNDQWQAFIHLSEPSENAVSSSTGSSRLLSGAGNRYDYWRIAWGVWRAHPLLGVGAGNYPRSYYERRATTEDIQQPHSIELQVLSELGIGGGLLLAAFVSGVGWGIARTRSHARGSPLRLGLMTAALGMFVAWLVQTSVDWMHLLPGLTAIALTAVAVLMWPAHAPEPQVRAAPVRLGQALSGRPAGALGVAAAVLTLIVAGASLSRQGLADLYRERAQSELARNPAAALIDANRSLYVDADSAQVYYVKAAALARFNQGSAAEAALVSALRYEPHNFVTWTLLGDIAVRERNLTTAARDYTRAHELNPRNAMVRELALDPRVALR